VLGHLDPSGKVSEEHEKTRPPRAGCSSGGTREHGRYGDPKH
jgi:hypothetical protein